VKKPRSHTTVERRCLRARPQWTDGVEKKGEKGERKESKKREQRRRKMETKKDIDINK
jgi:hypothetical protein